MYDIILINPTAEEYKAFKTKFPIAKKAESFRHAQKLAVTEFFWIIWNDCKVIESFDFSYTPDQWSKNYIHVFLNGNEYDGVCLVPKHATFLDKEITHRFFINKKEIDLMASVPVTYDTFNIDTYQEYLYALENSKTEMFWMLSKNLQPNNSVVSNFYISHHNSYDRNENHAFIHRVNDTNYYNGIFLCSKNRQLTQKEVEHRFIVNRKEWPIVASGPIRYDQFEVDSYDEYLYALENSKTEMFWLLSRNISVNEKVLDSVYVSHDNYDRKINHTFVHRVDGKDLYNGVFLCSKYSVLTKNEIEHRFIVNRKEWPIVASGPVKYDKFDIDSYDEYLYALENSKTEMFWGTSSKIKVLDTFNFNTYFSHDNEYDRKINHAFVHDVLGKHTYDGIFLFSKHTPVSKKEIEHRYLVHRKEWPTIASTYISYDIFEIDSFKDYKEAFKKSKTEMFWMTSRNIKIDQNFKFDIYYDYRDNEFITERKTNHAFIHQVDGKDLYNGVFLLSKYTPLSEKEIDYRHLVHRKEWPVVASGPIQYEKFVIETYDDYLHALENSKTEMFWGISNNIEIDKEFNFDIYFSHDNEYDRKINHAFIHRVDGQDLYNGVFLLTKHNTITEKEIEHRHLVHRKEWPVVASGPVRYDIFTIETYADYLYALENSKTEMFWVTSNNIEINEEFSFDVYFSHDNEYDRKINHAFIHRVDGQDLYNGVFLLTKHNTITEKEIEHRHLVHRKEWPVVASGPVRYEQYNINTYEEYLTALSTTKTEMFWIIPDYVTPTTRFKFDTYFSHNQIFERKINHVYLNGKYNDGIVLCSKHSKFSKREFDYRFISNKKEVNIVISTPKPYDIVFISYQEPRADEFYKHLTDRFSNTKRIHGVKGIHQAHIEAAKLCSTDMFWVVDGDALIDSKFNFDYQVARWDIETVHVWRSINPINDLVYGYGGVKLLPTELVLNMDISKPDMTTSISKKFRAVQEISNTTAFNTDPFNTWKSAFRECVKLSSNIIDRQKNEETASRLKVWCTVGEDRPFGKYATSGATAGKTYGYKNQNNLEALAKINDFSWLKEQFDVNSQ